MTPTAETPAKPCPTCGYPKYRSDDHAAWCWSADPTQPVAGADLVLDSNHKIRIVVRDERRHPEACLSCGCIRRCAWWCRSTFSPPGRVDGNSGGAALGEVGRAAATSDRRSA